MQVPFLAEQACAWPQFPRSSPSHHSKRLLNHELRLSRKVAKPPTICQNHLWFNILLDSLNVTQRSINSVARVPSSHGGSHRFESCIDQSCKSLLSQYLRLPAMLGGAAEKWVTTTFLPLFLWWLLPCRSVNENRLTFCTVPRDKLESVSREKTRTSASSARPRAAKSTRNWSQPGFRIRIHGTSP